MEQVKVSENGDMTFIIYSVLPGYLCSSHRRKQGWRALGCRSDPKGILLEAWRCIRSLEVRRRKKGVGCAESTDVLSFGTRRQGARHKMVKEQLILNIKYYRLKVFYELNAVKKSRFGAVLNVLIFLYDPHYSLKFLVPPRHSLLWLGR